MKAAGDNGGARDAGDKIRTSCQIAAAGTSEELPDGAVKSLGASSQSGTVSEAKPRHLYQLMKEEADEGGVFFFL